VVMALVLVLAIAAAVRAQSVHLVAYMAEAEARVFAWVAGASFGGFGGQG